MAYLQWASAGISMCCCLPCKTAGGVGISRSAASADQRHQQISSSGSGSSLSLDLSEWLVLPGCSAVLPHALATALPANCPQWLFGGQGKELPVAVGSGKRKVKLDAEAALAVFGKVGGWAGGVASAATMVRRAPARHPAAAVCEPICPLFSAAPHLAARLPTCSHLPAPATAAPASPTLPLVPPPLLLLLLLYRAGV